MLKDIAGHRLFRKVTIRVIFPDNIIPPKLLSNHADPHQGFGPEGIDAMLMEVADQLDTLYPFWEFRYTELKPIGRTARFIFQFVKYRAAVKPEDAVMPAVLPELKNIPNPKESSAPTPETAERNSPPEAKSEGGNTLAATPSQE